MMFGYGHAGGWPIWGVALMWVGMLAVAGLLIRAVYAAVGSASRRRGDGPGKDAAAPDRILGERLARGEINADEYTRLREALASGSTQRSADAASRN
jgi:putative membrane protein